MGISLVLGGNGQDGSLMAEHLVKRGDVVWAAGRQQEPRWSAASSRFQWHQVDLANSQAVRSMLDQIKPDRVYHLAAVHGAAGFNYETVLDQALDVNVKALHAVLEYARGRPGKVRVFYASSCKIFGTPVVGRIAPDSPRTGSCLYSVTKLAGHGLLDYYRRTHDVPGASAIFFNHESSRRAASYFIPQIVTALRGALTGKANPIAVRTLDFYADWGCANEYMELAANLLERDPSSDVLMATGTVHYGREFVAALFARHGYDWRDHVKETVTESSDQSLDRSEPFSIDLLQTQAVLGRLPRRTIFDVVDDMLAMEPSA